MQLGESIWELYRSGKSQRKIAKVFKVQVEYMRFRRQARDLLLTE